MSRELERRGVEVMAQRENVIDRLARTIEETRDVIARARAVSAQVDRVLLRVSRSAR